MKKVKLILRFLWLCVPIAIGMAIPLVVKPQSDSAFQFLKTIKGDFTYFNVDNLDNIYLITKNNQLKKLNANGDSVAVFNDVKNMAIPIM